MKSNRFLSVTMGVATVAGLMFTSCRKDNSNDNDTSSSADNNMAEHYSNDIVSIAAQGSDAGSTTTYRLGNDEETLSSCATVAVDTVNKIVTVTFNGGNCLDGRTRSGTLTINYSASTLGARHYRDPGFSCTITSSNYVVDGNQVNIINKTITNTTAAGFNPATTNLTWNVSATMNIIKANNGGTVSWTCNRTTTLLNTSDANVYHGSSTAISWGQARIGITGSANGTTAAGDHFTATVTSQLIRDFGGCNIGGRHPFIQGTMDFTPGAKATRHIDFGNGSCDNTATVTIGSHTYTVTM